MMGDSYWYPISLAVSQYPDIRTTHLVHGLSSNNLKRNESRRTPAAGAKEVFRFDGTLLDASDMDFAFPVAHPDLRPEGLVQELCTLSIHEALDKSGVVSALLLSFTKLITCDSGVPTLHDWVGSMLRDAYLFWGEALYSVAIAPWETAGEATKVMSLLYFGQEIVEDIAGGAGLQYEDEEMIVCYTIHSHDILS
ncbi:hypothetical protein C8R48DRAFT_676736 [Suillus tomentosus]|nr:hypothetical protein C8R48DRAFT_676736 [Suillus tomentosus]